MPGDIMGEMKEAFLDETQKTMFAEDAEHEAWNFKSTIAYWCTCMTIEGTILFIIGQFMAFPGMCPDAGKDNEYEYVKRAWVEWPFFIGGCAFTIANYLCYLQVINKHNSHTGHHPFRFFTWEDGETDGGHIATAVNLIGSLAFSVNTGLMFGWLPRASLSEWNINYIGTGVFGSGCFVAAAAIQGEYNEWRSCKMTAPVFLSHSNFWGSLMFLVGFALDFNKYASSQPVDPALGTSAIYYWAIDVPFLIGCLLFLVSSCIDLVLWQSERFGLGFAKSLSNNSAIKADVVQLLTIALITFNVCIAWVRISFVWAEGNSLDDGVAWSISEKILAYHGILVLMSVLHKAPDGHPWDYLTYFMRLICAFGLIGEYIEINAVMERYAPAW